MAVPIENIGVRLENIGVRRRTPAPTRASAHLGDPRGGRLPEHNVIGAAGMGHWPPSPAGVVAAPGSWEGTPVNTVVGEAR